MFGGFTFFFFPACLRNLGRDAKQSSYFPEITFEFYSINFQTSEQLTSYLLILHLIDMLQSHQRKWALWEVWSKELVPLSTIQAMSVWKDAFGSIFSSMKLTSLRLTQENAGRSCCLNVCWSWWVLNYLHPGLLYSRQIGIPGHLGLVCCLRTNQFHIPQISLSASLFLFNLDFSSQLQSKTPPWAPSFTLPQHKKQTISLSSTCFWFLQRWKKETVHASPVLLDAKTKN